MSSSPIPSSRWQTVQLCDVEPSPWRNGGGTTRELFAWPASQAWQWRASVAEVTQAGTFSNFGGVQRWFAVLEGDGVCLSVDGHLHVLSKADSPLEFDGAAQTECKLLGGATQDFNLMVRNPAKARMQRVIDGLIMTVDAPKTIAVYTHKQTARVQIGTEIHVLSPETFGWTHVVENKAIQVDASDALFMEINI